MPSRDLKIAKAPLPEKYLWIADRFKACVPGFRLIVTCTLRSVDEQRVAFRGGFSRLNPDDPAQKKRALHLPDASGLSRAVDVLPVENSTGLSIDTLLARGKVTKAYYDTIFSVLMLLVEAKGLRSGNDWNGDSVPVGPDPAESFVDAYHMEIT